MTPLEIIAFVVMPGVLAAGGFIVSRLFVAAERRRRTKKNGADDSGKPQEDSTDALGKNIEERLFESFRPMSKNDIHDLERQWALKIRMEINRGNDAYIQKALILHMARNNLFPPFFRFTNQSRRSKDIAAS